MKKFELPVSDCGDFMAGEIDKSIFDDPTKPKFGVVIWYESMEAAKLATQAVIAAHWGDGD